MSSFYIFFVFNHVKYGCPLFTYVSKFDSPDTYTFRYSTINAVLTPVRKFYKESPNIPLFDTFHFDIYFAFYSTVIVYQRLETKITSKLQRAYC